MTTEPNAATPPPVPLPPKAVQWRELAVFLALIVPSMLFGIVAGVPATGFAALVVATVFRDLSLLALVHYFLWRNGESPARIGWRPGRFGAELGWGLLLFAPLFIGSAVLRNLLQTLGMPTAPLPTFFLPAEQGPGAIVLTLILVAVVAVAEEAIFRGYLMLRIEGLTGSPTAAVLISSALFALGHGYQGAAGMVAVGALGIGYALVYRWRRCLVAPVAMHLLQDAFALALLWAGAGR